MNIAKFSTIFSKRLRCTVREVITAVCLNSAVFKDRFVGLYLLVTEKTGVGVLTCRSHRKSTYCLCNHNASIRTVNHNAKRYNVLNI